MPRTKPTIIICESCGEEEPHAAFNLCKRCYNKKWRTENRERYLEAHRNRQYRYIESDRDGYNAKQRVYTRKRYAEDEDFRAAALESGKKYYRENKEAHRETMNKWYRENKDHCIDYRLQREYNITLAEYDKMLEAQGGGCWICGKTPEENGMRLAVDHNHKTGRVRGILCSFCNTALGKFDDSVGLLARAIEYLEVCGGE